MIPQFMVLNVNGPMDGLPPVGKPQALCIGSVGDCQGVKAYREILWLKISGERLGLKPVSWCATQRPGAVLITAATDSNDSAINAAIAAAELEMVRRLGWIMGWGNGAFFWGSFLFKIPDSQWPSKIYTIYSLPLHSDTQCTLHPSTYFFQQHFGAQKTLSCRSTSMRDGTVMNSG